MLALSLQVAAGLQGTQSRQFALRRAAATHGTPAATPEDLEVPLQRQVFCNRALNMDKMQAVGFDMDYTLAEYKVDFDLLAFDGAIRKLRQLGYPEEIESFTYDADKYQRGLMIDKRRGNLVKLDRHKYAKVAYHGLTEIPSAERKAIYAQSYEQQPQFNPPDYASIDTEFLKVDVCLFSQLVDLKDRQGLPRATYAEVYKDVRNAVDLCHCDGEIKGPVAQNPARYIKPSPDLPGMLQQLKQDGKQVFLLTNSLYDYTEVVCTFLLGADWLDYFDLVIVGARKPGFLLDPYLPLFQIRTEDGSLENVEMGSPQGAANALAKGKVFQGGNWNHLHRMLQLRTGSDLMYVGDHMYSDILRSKRTLGWRTVLMVPELESEVIELGKMEEGQRRAQELRQARMHVDQQLRRAGLRYLALGHGVSDEQLEKLKAEREKLSRQQSELSKRITEAVSANHHSVHSDWGQLFKAGHQNSRWAQQVQENACLYTSHVTNFLFLNANLRVLEDLMPHDRMILDESDPCLIQMSLDAGDEDESRL